MFLQRRKMFIFMRTLGSRNRFAKNKKPFAKNKRKFIFKKIGEIFGDGSGATLLGWQQHEQTKALPSVKGSDCLEPSETVPEIRQKVRKTSPKNAGNPAKNDRKIARKVWNFFQKNARKFTKNAGKIAEKNIQKVSVWESEMTKTMEKQVHFCPRHPGPCRINSPKICGNSAKKQAENRQNRTGNAPKQCGNLPKIVPEIKQNCTRKAHKSVAKKLPNHVSNSPLWCRTSTGRPQLVRAAPLSGWRHYRPQFCPQFFWIIILLRFFEMWFWKFRVLSRHHLTRCSRLF